MKNLNQLIAAIAALTFLALSTGCTTTAAPTIQQGADAEITFDGLHRVDNSQADMAWARPDFDISGYTKIMLIGSGFEYRPEGNTGRTSRDRSRGGPFFMDDATRERFETTVSDTFRDELSRIERFTIVDEAGPDVLMVRGALLDVVSMVPPDNRAGRSEIFISSIGSATLVLELRDSESGAILARSIDRRAAERVAGTMTNSNRVTNASEVRRLVRFWATRLREGLDGFTGIDAAE